MPLLAILVPGAAGLRDGVLRTASKTLSGNAAFARYWPGDVVYVTEVAESGSADPLGAADAMVSELPYRVLGTPDRRAALEKLRPDVVLANLSMSEVKLVRGLSAPVVLNAENDLRSRLRWLVLNGASSIILVVHPNPRLSKYRACLLAKAMKGAPQLAPSR